MGSLTVLFGEPSIYQSNGYVEVSNLVHDEVTPSGEKHRIQSPTMVRQPSDTPWLATEVYLPGPKF